MALQPSQQTAQGEQGALLRGLPVVVLCAAAACAGTARAEDPAVRSCGNGDALAQIRVEACSALIAAGETVGRPTGWALIQRGFALGEAGDLERARADFEAALRLAPDRPDAHLGRGLVLWADGKSKDALPELDAALALWPDDAQALNARGLAHAALGQLDQAIADYDAALRLAPSYAAALLHRGQAHAAGNAWQAAIADYRAALALLRDAADAEDYRDMATDGIEDAVQGLQDEANALRRQPGGGGSLAAATTGGARPVREGRAAAADPPLQSPGALDRSAAAPALRAERDDPAALGTKAAQAAASSHHRGPADRSGTDPSGVAGTVAATQPAIARDAGASTVRQPPTTRSSAAADPGARTPDASLAVAVGVSTARTQ